ncbi:MAG: acetyl-CoA carboxylase biotin carboxyl carrier protein [Candidatus Omnitrophica bacterium]|nr:acetyl-CoA carboxylase biotin carboxyl carrier protein [Candidatus Omnitrophota bacterium]
MNVKEIKEMIQLMNENNLSEIELEKEGLKIRLKKNHLGAVEQAVFPEIRQGVSSQVLPAGEAKEASKTAAPAAQRTIIKSPMVGTFYAAPAPDAAPFVQAGSPVEVGQVICIIEAMKLMNEIKAEVRGKVAEILVNNGDPVEFGQPLFALE